VVEVVVLKMDVTKLVLMVVQAEVVDKQITLVLVAVMFAE
jgi:hypothetical protein